MKRSILEVARVIRSKNSGPFELTLDIMFSARASFELFRARNIITRELIGGLYGVDPADVLGIVYFEPCSALKVTLRRRIPSGAPGDTDIYGAQQHAPLLSLEFEDQEER
jgi:hypothetical protein